MRRKEAPQARVTYGITPAFKKKPLSLLKTVQIMPMIYLAFFKLKSIIGTFTRGKISSKNFHFTGDV